MLRKRGTASAGEHDYCAIILRHNPHAHLDGEIWRGERSVEIILHAIKLRNNIAWCTQWVRQSATVNDGQELFRGVDIQVLSLYLIHIRSSCGGLVPARMVRV